MVVDAIQSVHVCIRGARVPNVPVCAPELFILCKLSWMGRSSEEKTN